ncbi:conjugal transfer relaxosome DNA-binding protein TraM [Yersinia enterocolitica]
MPRIQTFVSNKIKKEIENLVIERKQEGATDAEVSVSSVTSMLIELGIRVYKLQREKIDNPFSQMEFNKVMLEHVAKTHALCSEISRMTIEMQELQGRERFSAEKVSEIVKEYSKKQVNHFFSTDNESVG